MLGVVAVSALLTGTLLAQDDGGPPDGGGGPGGPPPGESGGPGDFGGPGGPDHHFDPAQFQQRMMDQVRTNLDITNNDDWAAIKPLVQKVMDAQHELHAGMGGPPGMPGRREMNVQTSSERQALQTAVGDNAPVQQIKDALAKYRAARTEKQAELASAQDNLKAVLTVRQEAEAVLMGLLP